MSFGLTYSFAQELFQRVHDFDNDVFKVAFYTIAPAQSVAAYTATNEVSGSGYVAGGATATLTLSRTANVVTLSFSELTMDTPQAAVAFMLYNTSRSNKSVLVAPLIGVSGASEVVIRWDVPLITLTV